MLEDVNLQLQDEFKEKIIKEEEATQIWECTQEFYDDFIR